MIGLLTVNTGCDESLPPRDDPTDFLETTLTGESGTVVLNGDLSLVTERPGGFMVAARNLYDEVLQAEEAISIDISFHVPGNPSAGGTAHGDRNQLIDRSMIQGNLLTVEPDSSAAFFIQWDHAGPALWEQTGLSFYTQPGNPMDFSWFESGPITLEAEGTARMFKGVAPAELDGTQLTIRYTIFVGDPQEAEVSNFLALYDQNLGLVRLSWQTHSEVNNHGFKIERGVSPTDFPVVYPDLIPGQGTVSDTTYYTFLDSLDTSPGLRYYRLQRWYDFGFVVWPLDPSHPTAVIVP